MQRQSFLKGSAVLLIMVFITKTLGLIYKIPLTGMLGGGGMSCYAGAFAVFTPVFAAAAAGVPSAMSRIVSEQLSLGRYRSALQYRKAAMLIFSALSIGLSALLIAFSEPLAVHIIHIPKARYAVIAVSLTMIPATIMNVRRGWAEGMGSMTPTATSEICETAVKLALGLAFPYIVMRYAVESYEKYHGCFGEYCADMQEAVRTAAPYAAAASALGVSLASVAACIYLFARTRRKGSDIARSADVCGIRLSSAGKRIIKYAAPASLTAVVATLTSMADLLTITPSLERAMQAKPTLFAFLGAYGIAPDERAGFVYGSYTGLALTIFGLIPTFTAMLGKSILPSLSVACACGDSAEVKHSIRSMLLLAGTISLPAGMALCTLSRGLLYLFFAGSPAEAAVAEKPLAILGVAVIFMGISLPCLTALQACDRQLSAMLITLSGTLIKLILNMILIPMPRFGICGAAAATAVSQLFICTAALIMLLRGTGAPVSCLKTLFIPVLPAVLCTFTAYIAQQGLDASLNGTISRLGVLLSIALGSIICAVTLGLLCISPKNENSSILLKKISKNP